MSVVAIGETFFLKGQPGQDSGIGHTEPGRCPPLKSLRREMSEGRLFHSGGLDLFHGRDFVFPFLFLAQGADCIYGVPT